MGDIKDDIARYHNGQLTPAEMHALESRALNDHFLADALEGTAPLSTMELNDDISQLQSRLKHRIEEKKNIVMSRWTWPLRIAAGLLVLISATVVIISVQQGEPIGNLAINEEKEFAPPVLRESTPLNDSISAGNSAISSEAEPGSAIEKNVNPINPEREQKERNFSENAAGPSEQADASAPASEPERSKDAIVISDDAAVGKIETKEKFDAEESIVQASPQSDKISGARSPSSIKLDDGELKKRSAAEAPGASRDKATLLVKGKVTAEDGSELPGVNINIKGTNIGTVTDVFGNYQLSVPESDPTLVLSFIGYVTEEVNADEANQETNVKLAEDATQLSEVVVTGYGIQRDPSEISSTLELASPAGGKKAYKQYLERNLRYPAAAADAKVEGRVTIQFAVETTGELSEFKVLKGIGHGCDQEVMRLIQAGPKWSPSKRDKTSVRDVVRVRMRFQLPKK
ncbi:MAG: TonB family protein [Chryseolinea sp.]